MKTIYFLGLFFSYIVSVKAQNLVFRTNLAGYNPELPKKALLLSKTTNKVDKVLLVNDLTKSKTIIETKISNTWEPFFETYIIDFSKIKKKENTILKLLTEMYFLKNL